MAFACIRTRSYISLRTPKHCLAPSTLLKRSYATIERSDRTYSRGPLPGLAVAQRQAHATLSKPAFDRASAALTLPPGQKAEIRELQTFILPDEVDGSDADRRLGRTLVDAWRKDGILQITMPPALAVLQNAVRQSKNFFQQPHEEKARCIDGDTFCGYIASGEELTNEIRDYSEIFTVTKDLPKTDPRVQAQWPCHGSTPWPSPSFQDAMKRLMAYKGHVGETLLKLTALGLGLRDHEALNKLTADGWHHMRILRFPPENNTNGKGKEGRGIGSHTDYGLLVIASQDEVGGLFIRPPIKGESTSNWSKSAAGLHEDAEGWIYVAPQENVLTVFTGDAMQLLTGSYLPSTLHKVALNQRERFAFAYFHEPNFNAICQPFPELATPDTDLNESFHYGTHFTNMFMRNYPERITAEKMRRERKMDVLPAMREANGFSVVQ